MKTKAEILTEAVKRSANQERAFLYKEYLKGLSEERHQRRKEAPYKPSACPSCKFCFFNKEIDEWDCSAIPVDMFENSCNKFKGKEEE